MLGLVWGAPGLLGFWSFCGVCCSSNQCGSDFTSYSWLSVQVQSVYGTNARRHTFRGRVRCRLARWPADPWSAIAAMHEWLQLVGGNHAMLLPRRGAVIGTCRWAVCGLRALHGHCS